MRAIGVPELIDDPRFAEPALRFENRVALIALLDDAFAQRTLAEWREKLAGLSGAWGVVQTPAELCEDPAVTANGYLAHTTTMSGSSVSHYRRTLSSSTNNPSCRPERRSTASTPKRS